LPLPTPTEPDITFLPGDNIQGTEPLVVSDTIVARFNDADNVGTDDLTLQTHAWVVGVPLCGDTSVYTAKINYGDGTPLEDGLVDCGDTSQYAVFVNTDH